MSLPVTKTAVQTLLSGADVARIAKVSPEAVRLWRKAGHLQPVAKTPWGLWLYRLEDVAWWMVERERLRVTRPHWKRAASEEANKRRRALPTPEAR